MENPLVLGLQRRDVLSAEEVQIIESLCRTTRDMPAKRDLVVQGARPEHSTLLLSGVAARYNIIGNGSRQISAIHFPGDFVDLHSLLLAPMDHSVVALSDCRFAAVPHQALKEVTISHAHITRLFWMLTVIDAAIFRQWLIAAGRRSAEAQLAHMLCEFWTRLSVVKLVDGHSFQLPLNQTDISDAMGLSLVHANRTIQALRRRGLVEWSGTSVRILDLHQICRLAEFDPTYLQLQPAPR